MKLYANAKINIGLNVVSKRADGYHNLETVFYPVDMCDSLEITPAKGCETTLQVKGIRVDSSMQDNLVYKAYTLLKQDFNIPAVDIVLEKNVPFGAGLGGGSSDAANTLKAFNTMFSLGLSDAELEQYAVRLGADCPFFIKNKPVYATGIGNEFHPIELDLSGYQIKVVKPDVNVSTAVAYRGITPKPSEFNLLNLS
ncbi:MAG: 4-(cytidine 5'-diphospho)-2-C-methyl-D-erythritol kinase, partial [Paludibacteraceae bacterium]|nr:4-(cytidine 5'-diphospho)-2-C-methyl-D-erythritol kinase [Paludibacteraceae bacterium]